MEPFDMHLSILPLNRQYKSKCDEYRLEHKLKQDLRLKAEIMQLVTHYRMGRCIFSGTIFAILLPF